MTILATFAYFLLLFYEVILKIPHCWKSELIIFSNHEPFVDKSPIRWGRPFCHHCRWQVRGNAHKAKNKINYSMLC